MVTKHGQMASAHRGSALLGAATLLSHVDGLALPHLTAGHVKEEAMDACLLPLQQSPGKKRSAAFGSLHTGPQHLLLCQSSPQRLLATPTSKPAPPAALLPPGAAAERRQGALRVL
jgi:hypothetical protein